MRCYKLAYLECHSCYDCSMCGILGRTGRANASFDEAFAAIKHRGPDGDGKLTYEELTLAHCRLAILDVTEQGKQPMTDESGEIIIIFNGEVYNFKELRAGLNNKYAFHSESDTEVILYGYKSEGIDFFKKMRGMWAFVIYDKKSQKIILSRDILGIKPLYYSITGGELSFASEMRAMRHLVSSVSPNTDAYYQFFNLGYFIGENTCYREIKKVLPGEILVWDMTIKEFSREMLTFLTPSASKLEMSFVEAVEFVENILSESVESHFVSDVPVGLLLSGGNDSSLIAALAAKAGRKPIAYTLEIKGSIDTPYAQKVAQHLGLPHERIEMTEAMFAEAYAGVWDVLDEPFADSSIIPTTLIYRAMKGKTKVVLSGEGGDELFGGYDRHKYFAPLAEMRKSGMGDAFFSFYGTSSLALSTLNPALLRLRRMLERASSDLLGTYLSKVRLTDFPIAEVRIRKFLFDAYVSGSPTTLMNPASLFFDRSFYLPYDLLYKTDTASMASSIEARVPFLDREVFKVIGTIDPRYCLSPEYTDKILLKKIAEKYLPEDLVYRPKKGFSFSFKRYAGDLLLRDTEEALRFHAKHADSFGLQEDRLMRLLAPEHAPLLVSKYPLFAFALVSNWNIFKK